MSDRKTSGKRKKDYVTQLAVGLFVFIVIFELLIVTWLPRQLTNEKIWEREVAFQELIDLEDLLRRNIRGALKFKSKWEEGEAHLALGCLDEFAMYMRKHQSHMSREQIRELYEKLLSFERRYHDWENGRYGVTFEKLDVDPILKQSLERYENDERKNSKKQSGGDTTLFQD